MSTDLKVIVHVEGVHVLLIIIDRRHGAEAPQATPLWLGYQVVMRRITS